jgi:hypothetical protein
MERRMTGFVAPVLVPVITVEAQRSPAQTVSQTGKGTRQFVQFTGGTFEIAATQAGTFTAPATSGELIQGAAMNMVHSAELFGLDARYVLRTTGGHLIYVQAIGRRFGGAEVSDRLRRGLPVKRSEYYGCSSITIETDAPGLEWMNYHQFIGNATSRPDSETVRITAISFPAD